MTMQIKNSVVLISGANRGIGRALVEQSLQWGASRVYATARHLADLAPVVALDPERVRAIQLDVTNPEEIAAASAVAKNVNLLINNAGVADFGSLLEVPADAYRRDIETNYYGSLNMTRAFAPKIEANGGGAVANVLSL